MTRPPKREKKKKRGRSIHQGRVGRKKGPSNTEVLVERRQSNAQNRTTERKSSETTSQANLKRGKNTPSGHCRVRDGLLVLELGPAGRELVKVYVGGGRKNISATSLETAKNLLIKKTRPTTKAETGVASLRNRGCRGRIS